MLYRRRKREPNNSKYLRQERRYKETAARINCVNLLFFKGRHAEYPYCEKEYQRDSVKYGSACHKTPDCMLSFSPLHGDCYRCPYYTSKTARPETRLIS
jgi:hypothetical protein